MAAEITMPQLSDTMTEGTVVKWTKKEGEKIKAGDVIAEIETDKATMEMESFEAGTLAAIMAGEGEKIAVGGLIAVLATGSEKPAEIKKQYADAAAAGAKAPKAAKAESGGSTPAPGATATAAPAPAEHPAHGGNGKHAESEGGRLRVSPLASRIAAEHGVDLRSIRGSGPSGRIVQKDVEAAIAGKMPASAAGGAPQAAGPVVSLAPIVGSGQKSTSQMSKMRTAIATALQRSKQQVPHFYETIDIDLEQVVAIRERLNQKLEKEKVRLSINDFVYKAVAAALLKHPVVNSRFNAEKGEITSYGDVNLGIAVSIPDGLIVPVLRSVNQMGLKEIRVRSVDLVDRARAQRLKREESTEATFTISSLGAFGIREFSAIINPPEVAILAVGAAEKRPVVRDGQIVARMMMTVTLSCDHRVVDGAVAADFLSTLRGLLEEPGMLLV